MSHPSNNRINVPLFPNPVSDLSVVSEQLETVEHHWIKNAPWQDFQYQPKVQFAIAHTTDSIFLKFYVREQSVRAQMSHSNDPVYTDSCVEFFVAPTVDGLYYNFEFNGIGTCLAQVGTSRENRQFLDEETMKMIQTQSSLGTHPFPEKQGDLSWNLTIDLPKRCFRQHTIDHWTGQTTRANFYKCGDELSKPHYLVWHPIETSSPDFHRPEFFGELHFV